jgi:uncharacterized SAM-binding protein YcdF (DUF218 family)
MHPMVRWLLRPTRLIILLVVVWFVGVWYLLLHPKADHPAKADVVMVLSGDSTHRLPAALHLMSEHVAPTLIISDGANGNAEARKLCSSGGPPAWHVLCFRPNPYSTRGEAEEFARLAAQHGWKSVAVVSSPTHLTRLRVLFERCFKGKIYAVRSKQTRLSKIESVFWETGKLAYEETILRHC